MTFSYDDTLPNDRDCVRLWLNDTVIDDGPRPGSGNFSDGELDGLIDAEGSWQRAVAAGFEILASAWARYADMKAGPHSESLSQVAKSYREQAKEWRDKHGGAAPMRVAGIVKVDGYSDDVASDDVSTATEYAGIGFEYVKVTE